MSRPLRIQFPAAVYHVINRGAARQPTFSEAMFRSDIAGDRGFGIASYATVSWNCRAVGLQITKNKKFRDRIEKIAAAIIQPQT
jgi:hypothetical protein